MLQTPPVNAAAAAVIAIAALGSALPLDNVDMQAKVGGLDAKVHGRTCKGAPHCLIERRTTAAPAAAAERVWAPNSRPVPLMNATLD